MVAFVPLRGRLRLAWTIKRLLQRYPRVRRDLHKGQGRKQGR